MTDAEERARCSCYYISEHRGRDAAAYAREHLAKVTVHSRAWATEYRCPLYGQRWLFDEIFPKGGGERLRTFDTARRDLLVALTTVSALLPADQEANDAVAVLTKRLGEKQ